MASGALPPGGRLHRHAASPTKSRSPRVRARMRGPVSLIAAADQSVHVLLLLMAAGAGHRSRAAQRPDRHRPRTRQALPLSPQARLLQPELVCRLNCISFISEVWAGPGAVPRAGRAPYLVGGAPDDISHADVRVAATRTAADLELYGATDKRSSHAQRLLRLSRAHSCFRMGRAYLLTPTGTRIADFGTATPHANARNGTADGGAAMSNVPSSIAHAWKWIIGPGVHQLSASDRLAYTYTDRSSGLLLNLMRYAANVYNIYASHSRQLATYLFRHHRTRRSILHGTWHTRMHGESVICHMGLL